MDEGDGGIRVVLVHDVYCGDAGGGVVGRETDGVPPDTGTVELVGKLGEEGPDAGIDDAPGPSADTGAVGPDVGDGEEGSARGDNSEARE